MRFVFRVFALLAIFSSGVGFAREGVASEAALFRLRKLCRSKIIERGDPLMMTLLHAPVKPGDYAAHLVDDTDARGQAISLIKDIEALDAWREGRLPENLTPWSGHYWPYSQGTIGARYASREFLATRRFSEAKEFISAHPTKTLIEAYQQNPSSYRETIDVLAPSEKYDLLIGDAQGSLTDYAWNEADRFRDERGDVESWMGICDGWSSASIMLPRPAKKVSLEAAADQIPLEFYPADLMALASYLWSHRGPRVKFVGGRCDVKDPKRDPQNGRLIDENCFNNNPATWHLAVIHQIQQAQRSLVVDIDFQYEVWNQPVVGYRISYFNLHTGEPVATLQEAVVPYKKNKDRFVKYRKADTFTHLVGVQMTLDYVSEISPSRAESNSIADDSYGQVQFAYDLELNYVAGSTVGEIVGGEWHSTRHPDFLWLPYRNSEALSYGEESLQLEDWSLADKLFPEAWKPTALMNSSYGSPLGRAVQSLFERSREN